VSPIPIADGPVFTPRNVTAQKTTTSDVFANRPGVRELGTRPLIAFFVPHPARCVWRGALRRVRSAAGIDSLLLTDLPPNAQEIRRGEVSRPWWGVFLLRSLHNLGDRRIATIDRASDDFIY